VVAVDQYATNVLPVAQVLISLVDVLEPVPGGDQIVEVQLTRVVETQQSHDVVLRVGRAEERALDRLLVQGEHRAGDVDGQLRRVGEPGHHHCSALADDVERGGHDLLGDRPDGD